MDPYDLSEAEKAIKENTKALYIESLGNPNGDVVDIEAWADVAHKHGLPLIIDNTLQALISFVRLSTVRTSWCIPQQSLSEDRAPRWGGIVVDAGRFDWTKGNKWPWLTEPNPSYHGVRFAVDTAPAVIATYLRAITIRDEGAAISPFNAWVLIQGLESLAFV